MTVPAAIQTVPVTGKAEPPARRAPGLFGRRRAWARDFGLIGGVTGFAAPLMVYAGFPLTYYALTGVGGLVAGAALGALLPTLLGERLRRLPVLGLLALGPAVGAIWGGLAGFAGGWIFRDGGMDLDTVSVAAGAAAGAVQFGWLWVPYTVRRARKKRVWPLLLGAAAAAPALGWAALAIVELLF